MGSNRFYIWLSGLPEESLQHLRQINNAATSAGHVLLALTIGVYDQHVRKLNKIIVGLLLSRMKAQRRSDCLAASRINEKLEQLHAAIDAVTDVAAVREEMACVRVKKGRLRAG